MKKYNEWKTKIEDIIKGAKNVEDFYTKITKYDKVRKKAREEIQQIVNTLCKAFHTTHPPIYLSTKYKIKKMGLYFQKQKIGAIVVFPIRSYKFYSNGDKPQFWVLSYREVINIVKHEVAHHLSRKNPGHGEDFRKALRKIEKIKI